MARARGREQRNVARLFGGHDSRSGANPRKERGLPESFRRHGICRRGRRAADADDPRNRRGIRPGARLRAALEHELAHYYRFAEIWHGKELVPNPHAPPDAPADQKYIYGGPAIPFNPHDVWPAVANPKAALYPAGSKARYACDTFNYTYTGLLKVLHLTFNGQPHQLSAAIGLMESLKAQAMDMMAIELGNGTHAGPSFEYQPINP